MLIISLSSTLISLTSGLLGFAWAVAHDPDRTHLYVQAGLATLLFQVPLMAIASKNKDRIARSPEKLRRHLRSELAATVGGAVFLIAGVAVLFSFGASELQAFLTYFALGMLAVVLQLTTFVASSSMVITNLTRFWLIQLVAATTRLVMMILLVRLWNQSFLGILLANVSGAIVGNLCYKRPLPRPRAFFMPLKRVSHHVGRLVTLDGSLRAARLYYEQLLISLTLITTDALNLLDPDTVKYMYASSGYLNAETTAARQVFLSQELKAFQRRLRPVEHAIVSALFLAGSVLIWQADRWTRWHHTFLPAIPPPGPSVILGSVAVAAALQPFTLGFAYLDFLPPCRLRKAAVALVALPIPIFFAVRVTVLQLDFCDFPFWATITPLSIGISKRFW